MKKLIVGTVAALTMIASTVVNAQDATPKAYMIGSYDITDQAVFDQYIEAASPLVAQYGGRVIVYNPNVAAIEGTSRSVIAIAEFPSLADAERPLLQFAGIHRGPEVLHRLYRRVSDHH